MCDTSIRLKGHATSAEHIHHLCIDWRKRRNTIIFPRFSSSSKANRLSAIYTSSTVLLCRVSPTIPINPILANNPAIICQHHSFHLFIMCCNSSPCGKPSFPPTFVVSRCSKEVVKRFDPKCVCTLHRLIVVILMPMTVHELTSLTLRRWMRPTNRPGFPANRRTKSTHGRSPNESAHPEFGSELATPTIPRNAA